MKKGARAGSFVSEWNVISKARQEGISDRHCESRGVGVVELLVVVDHVIMRFRTHEEMSPNIDANIGAKMPGKVVAADVVRATGETAAIQHAVEPQVFAA